MSRQRAGPALTQGVTSSLLDPKRAPPRRRCRSRQTCRHSERQKARSSARVVPALDRAVRRLNAGTTACGGLMLPKCALTLAILGVAVLVVSALVAVLVVDSGGGGGGSGCSNGNSAVALHGLPMAASGRVLEGGLRATHTATHART
jgi:hypothetical protein